MNEKIISQICLKCFAEEPEEIERCAVGQANYVYIVEGTESKYVFRCSTQADAYDKTIYWLRKLESIEIPVPKVIKYGRFEEFEYLILNYFEGKDIGVVYSKLKDEDKRAIAKEIVRIQHKVAALKLEDIEDWSWCSFIKYILERSRERITQNGYFDAEKVERLDKEMLRLKEYFDNVRPVAYLDDISSKNLLIHNGRISGIIDIDWMGTGDKLTFAALTNVALLNMEYDTDYVKYILEELQVNETQKKAFLFYSLMYCVDFMGERGMQFMDKTIEVNEQIVDRLNGIYELLWDKWSMEMSVL